MAGVGDAKARKYVIDELIRRTAGLSAKRRLPNSKVEGDIEALNTWHNLKTPWIRMVSNAVPKTEATSGVPSTGYAEYEETVELFGGADPDNSTRFHRSIKNSLVILCLISTAELLALPRCGFSSHQ